MVRKSRLLNCGSAAALVKKELNGMLVMSFIDGRMEPHTSCPFMKLENVSKHPITATCYDLNGLRVQNALLNARNLRLLHGGSAAALVMREIEA